MTKREPKNRLQIPTRMARPKGDMFHNLRKPEEVESLSMEELVAPPPHFPEDKPGSPQKETTQPYPTLPNPTQPKTDIQGSAPARDFNRRANSLERDALPSGLFPGTSKKLYDALYLRTRGAISPVRTVQATRRELMMWSGIGSKNTIATNLQILVSIGLVIRNLEIGDRHGSIYEIKIPEELGVITSTLPNPAQPSPAQPNPTQKLGRDPTQLLGRVGYSNSVDSIGTYSFPKTSFKTDDDTHTLAEMNRVLLQAARDVVGVNLEESEQETSRWRELGQLLADELKTAARRTGPISSAPAFLTAHLRRLAQKTNSANEVEKTLKVKPKTDQPLMEEGGKVSEKAITPEQTIRKEGRSRFSFDECRRYANHLNKTGQGITNPGGYATTIHRTGEADELIEKFLHPPAPSAQLDASQCPDCRGTGWWYPKGQEMGVAKCKHVRLT